MIVFNVSSQNASDFLPSRRRFAILRVFAHPLTIIEGAHSNQTVKPMHALLNIAVSAARKAGSFISRAVERVDTLQVDSKGYNDFVSEVDRRAEREIIQVIHKAYPRHAILAEESGEQGDNESVWIIDPLDGTTNFLHGSSLPPSAAPVRN